MDCVNEGGSDKTCLAKAMRIANFKFSEVIMEKMKIPQGAMRFVQTDCHAHLMFAEGDESKPKLNMKAYSGKVIKGHWWWGDLAIDMSGMQFQKKKYPILEEHREDKKIAFSKKPPVVTEKNELIFDPDAVEFTDTEESLEFQKLSKKGFPYEASVYVTPTVIERLNEGEKAEVNGFTLKGPNATVFRESVFNEASVCVFGWDRQTQSSAFSREETELEVEVVTAKADQHIDNGLMRRKEVKKKMTKEEFAKEHPDLMKEIEEGIRKEVASEFAKREVSFSTEIKDLKEENDKKNERILELEKKDTIRAEAEMKASAQSIWMGKLSVSNIPEHLYEKVQKHVGHSKFVKDGILNAEEFGKAIDLEIEDWEKRGVTSTVMGTGFANRGEESTESKLAKKEQEENEKATNELLSLAGQKKK